MPESFASAIPVELAQGSDLQQIDDPSFPDDKQIASFIRAEMERLDRNRQLKKGIWDECWMLYRGTQNFEDKEDWQSKITLPKSWNAVKQATNAIMRLLQTADKPWTVDPTNPDDKPSAIRGEQLSKLLKVFLENGDFFRAFSEGLESGFITGIGVWKVWWALEPRLQLAVQTALQNGQPVKQILQQEILEGKLKVRAVDPYNFFWLPGSRFNRWTGTIEQHTVSRYELLDMVERGVFGQDDRDKQKVRDAIRNASTQIDAHREQSRLRFSEVEQMRGGAHGQEATTPVKLTEYYGPLLDRDGGMKVRQAHVIMAGDTPILKQTNQLWERQPPYVAFSPLLLPFRAEGVGLVEMSKEINKAFSQLTNLGMDKLIFELLPIFEAMPDAYENPEELETGLVPGKILKRDVASGAMLPLTPVRSGDISGGTVQMAGILDRAFQEGSLITEIQQGIPRFRGAQTLGEIEIKSENQQTFMTALARDVDEFAVKPLVELSLDLMMQFMSTANDPRIGSILGVGAETLKGLGQADLLEMVAGDYIIKVSGITDQIAKREQLAGIIQFMNIVGQNAEAWMPFIDQSELLQRILEALRPAIRDIDNIVHDPATVEAKRVALQNSQLTPEILKQMPQILKIAGELNRQGTAEQQYAALQPVVEAQLQQQAAQQREVIERQQELAERQEDLQDKSLDAEEAELEARKAEADRIKRGEAPVGGRRGNS